MPTPHDPATCGHDHSHDHVHAPQTPFVRDTKISRNDPCPCGSGQKYKKCCAGKTLS